MDEDKKEFFESHSKRFSYSSRLKNGCSRCGTKGKKYLQFHHRNPKEKLFDIGWAIGRQSISKELFDQELEKCDVLCVVCHKREHKNNPSLKGFYNADINRMKKLDRIRNKIALNKNGV